MFIGEVNFRFTQGFTHSKNKYAGTVHVLMKCNDQRLRCQKSVVFFSSPCRYMITINRLCSFWKLKAHHLWGQGKPRYIYIEIFGRTCVGPATLSWCNIITVNNHKNYNFLTCDWCKKVLFFTNSLAKLLSDSLLLDSLLLDSLLLDSSISQSHLKM